MPNIKIKKNIMKSTLGTGENKGGQIKNLFAVNNFKLNHGKYKFTYE